MINTQAGHVAQVWHDAAPPTGLHPGWYGSVVHSGGVSVRVGPHPTEEKAETELERRYREWQARRI